MAILIEVSGQDYRMCDENSHNMWANTKQGAWGGGIVNSATDPRKVERSGRIGEQAYALYMGKEVDWTYRRGGDNKDFSLGSFSVDVKTSSYNPKKSPDAALIKYIDARRGKLQLKCDVYVACEITYENREQEIAKVAIHGWVARSEIQHLPRRAGIYGYKKSEGKGWMNAIMKFDSIHPINQLLDIQQILED